MTDTAIKKVYAFINVVHETTGDKQIEDSVSDVMRLYREGDFDNTLIRAAAEKIGYGVYQLHDEGGYDGCGDEYVQALVIIPLEKLGDAFHIFSEGNAVDDVRFITANDLDVVLLTASYCSWEGIDWYSAVANDVTVTPKTDYEFNPK